MFTRWLVLLPVKWKPQERTTLTEFGRSQIDRVTLYSLSGVCARRFSQEKSQLQRTCYLGMSNFWDSGRNLKPFNVLNAPISGARVRGRIHRPKCARFPALVNPGGFKMLSLKIICHRQITQICHDLLIKARPHLVFT